MEKYYIWETERWEVFISQNKEIFKVPISINKDKIKLTDDWEKNKELYRELYNERVYMIIP